MQLLLLARAAGAAVAAIAIASLIDVPNSDVANLNI